MASLEIRIVQASPDWRGSEAETLAVMAKKEGWCRIYKYTNAYSHTDSHTHYSLIQWEEEEADLFSVPMCTMLCWRMSAASLAVCSGRGRLGEPVCRRRSPRVSRTSLDR
jgi:hypothetical protein